MRRYMVVLDDDRKKGVRKPLGCIIQEFTIKA
jgi:hypothetical protein